MNQKRRVLLAGMLTAFPALASSHPLVSESERYVSRSLNVGGRVRDSMALTPEELAHLPIQMPREIPVIARNGEVKRVLENYLGGRLTDVLERAGLQAEDHNDLKRTTIMASATDDYRVVFS